MAKPLVLKLSTSSFGGLVLIRVLLCVGQLILHQPEDSDLLFHREQIYPNTSQVLVDEVSHWHRYLLVQRQEVSALGQIANSKPAGNTAQDLCDMAGNVWEWVQDWYHSTYDGAPTDGSAWESPSGSWRVVRGGGFGGDNGLRAAFRHFGGPPYPYVAFGFRCAR